MVKSKLGYNVPCMALTAASELAAARYGHHDRFPRLASVFLVALIVVAGAFAAYYLQSSSTASSLNERLASQSSSIRSLDDSISSLSEMVSSQSSNVRSLNSSVSSLSEALSAQENESSLYEQNFMFLKDELSSTGSLFFFEVNCLYVPNYQEVQAMGPCFPNQSLKESPFQFVMGENSSHAYINFTQFFFTYIYSGQNASVSFNSTLPVEFQGYFLAGPPPSTFTGLYSSLNGTTLFDVNSTAYSAFLTAPADGLYAFCFAYQSTRSHPPTSVSFYATYGFPSPL